MGSDQAGINIKRSRVRRLPVEPVFLWLGVLALVALVGGEWAREILSYERAAIANGEWWRVFSGHLVHLDSQHGLLNLLALGLIGGLVRRDLDTLSWLIATIICVLGVSLGLWVFAPEVLWYVGLSGVLHGLLAAYAAERAQSLPWLGAIILGGLFVKVGYEQWFGPLPTLSQFSGGAVVVDAHLFGVLAGILAGLSNHIRVRTHS